MIATGQTPNTDRLNLKAASIDLASNQGIVVDPQMRTTREGVIADAKTKKLLGAHILAPEGADSIQTAALAIKAGMTYEELGAMIFPYLTTVEGLKLAAQTFDMDVKNYRSVRDNFASITPKRETQFGKS